MTDNLALSEANQLRSEEKLGTNRSTRTIVVRIFRDWLKPYRHIIGLAILFMIVNAAATSSYPLLIKLTFDIFEGAGSIESYPDFVRPMVEAIGGGLIAFLFLPGLIFAVTVVAGGANYFQAVLSNTLSLRTIRDFQGAMFGHLMHADLTRLQKDRSGELISRFITDVNLMRDALGKALTGIVRDLLKIIFLTGVMIYLNWQLTLAIAIIFPIGARPIIRIGRRMRRASGNVQQEAGELTSTLEQAFSSARFIKSYGLERQQQNVARATFQRLYQLRLKMVKGRARTFPITEVFGGLAFGGVLTFAGFQILAGSATIGDFSGFLFALPMVYQPVRSLGSLNTALQEGLAAAERIFLLIDDAPKIVDKPEAPDLVVDGAGTIRFSHVGFSYAEGVAALSDVDIEISAGQTVALVGPSGAGKSTILNLVPRLYEAGQGSITIDGQDVRDVTMASLRRNIAVVSQDVTLFNDTIEANIRMGRADASDDEVRAAAKAAAAHEFIMQMRDGYRSNVGDRGQNLSGGERQRIAIARAVLKDAPILLLDEATSALDAASERQVQDALTRLAEGRTTVVIAHRLTTVMEADRIFVLDRGSIVEAGKHDELRALGGLYEHLCQLQFRDDQDVTKAAFAGDRARAGG